MKKTLCFFLLLSSAATFSCDQNSRDRGLSVTAASLCRQECQNDTELFIDENLRQCYCTDSSGLMHGKFVEWYENGQKKIDREFWYGDLIGVNQTWYENGDPKGDFEWLVDENLYVVFREIFDRHPVLEGAYIDGMPYGNWIYYDLTTGNETMNANFVSGVYCGTIRCNDPNGRPAPCADDFLEQFTIDGCNITGTGAECPACPILNL